MEAKAWRRSPEMIPGFETYFFHEHYRQRHIDILTSLHIHHHIDSPVLNGQQSSHIFSHTIHAGWFFSSSSGPILSPSCGESAWPSIAFRLCFIHDMKDWSLESDVASKRSSLFKNGRTVLELTAISQSALTRSRDFWSFKVAIRSSRRDLMTPKISIHNSLRTGWDFPLEYELSREDRPKFNFQTAMKLYLHTLVMRNLK